MRRLLVLPLLLGSLVFAAACGEEDPGEQDGGPVGDGGSDAGTDAGTDAGPGGLDGGTDGGATDAPPVNQVPASVQLIQGASVSFTGNLAVADADAQSGDLLTLTLSVASGTLTLSTVEGLSFQDGTANGGPTLKFSGTLAAVNAALNGSIYVPLSTFFGEDTLSVSTVSNGLSDEDACDLLVAESLPPTSSDWHFFAPDAAAIPVEIRAQSNHAGIFVDRAIVTACSGDSGSTLVLDGVTVDCGALPFTIPVVGRAGDNVLSAGVEHRFIGTWTPGPSSPNTLDLTVAFEDSQQTPRRSQSQAVTFLYRYVNKGPTLQFVPPGETHLPGTEITNTVTFTLQGQSGGGAVPYAVADPDSGEDNFIRVDVDVVGGTPGSTAYFPQPQSQLVLVRTPGKAYTINGPVSVADYVLRALIVEITDANSVEYDVVITVSDNGFLGACAVDNPSPCAKTATATLHVVGVPPSP